MSDTNMLGDLKNKTVLEIGSGRGDATRELATRMSGSGGRLIVTDISGKHFESLRADLDPIDLVVEFIRTSPLKLAGIRPSSIDLVVCIDALSAINAIVGQGDLALRKFYEVLQPGGTLYIEEELPFYMAASPAQHVWADQLRLFKAAQLLAGMRPSNAYQPDVLEALVIAAGFEKVDISDEVAIRPAADWWDEFRTRFENSINEFDDDKLKGAFFYYLGKLEEKANITGNMEVPNIILTAKKPWRVE